MNKYGEVKFRLDKAGIAYARLYAVGTDQVRSRWGGQVFRLTIEDILD